MAEDEPRKNFLKEIAKEASSYRRLRLWNQFAFGLLTLGSFLSSFIAAILLAQNRPVDHTQVIATGESVREQFTDLLRRVIAKLA